MATFKVSATEFRKSIHYIANSVGYRGDRYILTRHGEEVFVAVSLEDFVFLERQRPKPAAPRAELFPPASKIEERPPPVVPPDPWTLPIEEVRVLYEQLKDSDEPAVLWWTYGALSVLDHPRFRGRGPPS